MIKNSKTNKSSKTRKNTKQDDVVVEPHKNASKPFFLIIIIGIVLIAAVIVLIQYFLNGNQAVDISQETKQAEQVSQTQPISDLQDLKNRVGQLIEVNNEEDPTIATVNDPEILRQSQPDFYKDAVVGDRLLVWSDKAVLYSTKKDKLLSVMLINNSATEQEVATTTDATNDEAVFESTVEDEEPMITVLNGTRIAGLAGKMRTELISVDIPVNQIGDANIKTYTTTTIIKLTEEEMPATLKALQNALDAELSDPLEEERDLQGDYVVIVGTDYN